MFALLDTLVCNFKLWSLLILNFRRRTCDSHWASQWASFDEKLLGKKIALFHLKFILKNISQFTVSDMSGALCCCCGCVSIDKWTSSKTKCYYHLSGILVLRFFHRSLNFSDNNWIPDADTLPLFDLANRFWGSECLTAPKMGWRI